jgi:FAD/FMN-containing dehydrogenase
MITSNFTTATGLDSARDLRGHMKGKVVTVGDADYAQVREIWNGAVEHQPALFALCETTSDVQAAVNAASAYGLPLSVRAGGHDFMGRGLRDKGLVIDLTRMRGVTVDAESRIAIIEGGATSGDVATAASLHGLAAVTANVGVVGMGGFLLGGGYGALSSRFGFAADNLLGAEVVLADGKRVWADALQNHDLFWALRGGGGNFGAVTSMRIALYPVDKVLAGLIVFPWSQTEAVLHGYAEIMSSAPDELSMLAVVLPMANGSPAMFLGPIWSGDPKEGEMVMARLESLGTPILSQVAWMGYSDLLTLYDSQVANGRHYASQTRWLSHLTSEVISAIVAASSTRTSPLSMIALHYSHGAMTRLAGEATAFGMRQRHFMLEIIPAWEPCSNEYSAVHRRWASDLASTLAPLSMPGGYANFLAPDDHEQIASAYGNNARRLRDMKRKFDPDNVFSSAIPLPF